MAVPRPISAKYPELTAELTVPWHPLPTPRYVFTNANLVDPVEGKIIKGATIHLNDGVVVSVNGKDDEWSSDPKVVRVDVGGKYVVPGLIDCHVHLAITPGGIDLEQAGSMGKNVSILRQPAVCKSMLERGFTTVRDCGGATLPLKQAIEQGVHIGPRLFIASHALSQTGGHGDMRKQLDYHECCGGERGAVGRVVDGVPECFKYTRENLRQGADFIKIMGGGGVASPTDKIEATQFSDEEIHTIVTVASNAKTYVTTHAYTPTAIQQAINQGVKGVEHGNLIDAETAQLMAKKGVFYTPTLVTYAAMSAYKGFLAPASEKKNSQVLTQGLEAIKIAQDAGVTIAFGTDLLGVLHFAQPFEFSLRQGVQSNLQILQSATINSAALLQQKDFLGQIAPGFSADLLIVNANPLDDISIFDEPEKHILATVKEGKVLVSRWSKLDTDIRKPVILE
ncbi:hypothetical protein DV735_g2167, partial [Chaetothyriales sp. CBS 134920]